MPGRVTHKFRLHNAEQFYEAFSEAAPTQMYVFLARTNACAVDNSPPTPEDDIRQTNYDVWRNMIAVKKVTSSDVTYAAGRNNWSNNTFYTKYTDKNVNLASNTFHVITDTYNVYKCLDNNNNANSTVKPTSTSTSTVRTSDGYKWKYMYSVSAASALKHLTTNYIPVQTLSANDGSAQWTVQQAAANGSLEVITVANAGVSWFSVSGNPQAVTNATTITLPASASGNDDFYNNSTLYISAGLGAGAIREVINYNGTTKVATVNNAFSTTPNTSSTIFVGPKVTITGDGRDALAYANTTSGGINEVIMINNGNNYSFASVTISANSGSGAVANVYVPPQGGHGADPVSEMFAYNVMLNVKMTGTESNTFFTNNDFRVVGIMASPLLANGSSANGSVYDQTRRLTLTSVSGTFTYDEVINGGTSSATGRIVSFANTNGAGTAGVLRVAGTGGTWSNGETITGNSSSVTATIAGITEPDLKPFSGDVLFVENRPPVSRASDQIEDIKLIVGF